MSIGKVCSRVVHTAEREETVQAVASRMKQHDVGTVVVVEGAKPVGILTDRDLVVRVLTEGRAPATTRVDGVMTQHPRTLPEGTSIEDALASMRQLGVRRMPVVDARGELVGLLSIDDVLELLAAELGNVGRVVAQSTRGSLPSAPPPRRAPPRGGIERSGGDAEC